jgi:hypothetical protein
LAFILVQRNMKLDEALSLALTCVAASPSNAGYQDTLAWAYHAKHQDAKASEIIGKITRIATNPGFSYHKGMIALALGHQNVAKQAFHQALRLDPNYKAATEQLKAMGN